MLSGTFSESDLAMYERRLTVALPIAAAFVAGPLAGI
jgi:hypothetical protein